MSKGKTIPGIPPGSRYTSCGDRIRLPLCNQHLDRPFTPQKFFGYFWSPAIDTARFCRVENGFSQTGWIRFLLVFLILAPSDLGASDGDLVGVTWNDSVLISFDPENGQVSQRHVQLNPYEAFRALAYDRNHDILYALPQGTRNLYAIHADTGKIRHIGNLRIDTRVAGFEDAGALAYDPHTDTLYTAVEHWQGPNFTHIYSEICKVDVTNAALTTVGRIDGPFIESLAFDEVERTLYGLAVFGSGPFDSPFKTHVARIDPETAAMELLFETPYHTMLGLASRRPGSFISWVNWTTQFYVETDLVTRSVTLMGISDEVGVLSAMIAKDFSLPSRPVPAPAVAAAVEIAGSIDFIWDPNGVLAGRIKPGQRFSGFFAYDVTAPYKLPDPNGQRPYGISLHVGSFRYAVEGLFADVSNNFFDAARQTVTDSFELQSFARNGASINWSLSDSTANALGGNDRLPQAFDLRAWDSNSLVIAALDTSNRPLYYLFGHVDHAVRRSSVSLLRRPFRR